MIATTAGRRLLASALNGSAPSDSREFEVRLVKENFTEDPTALGEGSYVEAEFGGYARKELELGDNSDPALVDGNAVVRIGAEPLAWTCSALPETIFGWYIWDVFEEEVLFVERYPIAHEMEIGSVHTLTIDVAVGACG